ncbi:hypothetical protein H5410_021831 [Solanum commersonii]|uniref:Uncharacterized protein n=1 Tax=Solanum commersonii TaxID=4109 RepID=A0A9J5ZI92_SOLCO|nr:hypothetical protein H5410_021831 [Solanum commersonii]
MERVLIKETGILGMLDYSGVSKQVKSEESTRSKSKFLELKPFESSSSSKPSPNLELKTTTLNEYLQFSNICAATNYLVSLVEISDQLGDPPFGRFHRRLALSSSIVVFWIIGRYSIASWNCSAACRLLLFIADLILSFRAQHTGTKQNSSSIVQKRYLEQCYTKLNHEGTQQESIYLCKDQMCTQRFKL